MVAHFFLWLSLLIISSFLLGNIWLNIAGKRFQILVFIGVLVHELSHVLGCFLVGSRVEEINLFSSRGSYVKYRKPKIPVIGDVVINLFPLVGGVFSIWLSTLIFNISFSKFDIEIYSFFQLAIMMIREVASLFIHNWNSFSFWIFIYFLISIMVCLVPSKQDLKNSFVSILLILIAIFVLLYFNIIDSSKVFLPPTMMFVVGSFFGLMAIIFSFPIYILKKSLLALLPTKRKR